MARLRPKPNSTPDDIAFGINPCAMALEAGAAKSLFFFRDTKNERVLDLVRRAEAAGLTTTPVDAHRLDELTADGVHQGVLVRLRHQEPVDLAAVARNAGHASLVILVDRVTDPQNLGAILRTAVAVGVDAVVLPPRRGALLTPGVHRASAGLSFIAPVAAPQNLAMAIRTLKEHDYWVVAADAGEGSQSATAFDWPRRTALIMGSEGEGVAHLLRRESDFAVALPMDPRVESLNVGVAMGALAYLFRRQWPSQEPPSNNARELTAAVESDPTFESEPRAQQSEASGYAPRPRTNPAALINPRQLPNPEFDPAFESEPRAQQSEASGYAPPPRTNPAALINPRQLPNPEFDPAFESEPRAQQSEASGYALQPRTIPVARIRVLRRPNDESVRVLAPYFATMRSPSGPMTAACNSNNSGE